jgi:mersacidin/lichenicidin family type 2 lantibiotic
MLDIIRAWKDPAYRASLSQEERNRLPVNPAGLVELTDEELMKASGLATISHTTCECCTDTSRPFHCCP